MKSLYTSIQERLNPRHLGNTRNFSITGSTVILKKNNYIMYTGEEIQDMGLFSTNEDGEHCLMQEFYKDGDIIFPKGTLIEQGDIYDRFFLNINVYTQKYVFKNLLIGDIIHDELWNNNAFAKKATINDINSYLQSLGNVKVYEFHP